MSEMEKMLQKLIKNEAVKEAQWHLVTDRVRALFDGGWRAEDGAEALEAEYGMTAAEAAKTVQGLEALEADLEARALMDAIEEQDDEIPEGPTSCSAARGRSSRIIHEKNRIAIEVKASKSLVANGSGLAVNVTKEARLLGLRRGDAVEITMRRL